MHDLKSALNAAAGEGIISTEQADRLAPYLAAHGIAAVSGVFGELALPRDGEPERTGGESEAPRFVRGFHDVLITIGIAVFLAGVWGLGSIFALLPAIVVLAEIFVRRQRLALPAVALTIAFARWSAAGIGLALDTYAPPLAMDVRLLLLSATLAGLIAAFYWRYRVPLALALVFVAAVAALLMAVLLALSRATGADDFIVSHRLASSAIFLTMALLLFAVAMRFDLSDPQRVTRRSDVAFWLHLAAAPALLYATLSFVFFSRLEQFPFFTDIGLTDSAAVVLIVTVLMLIGLVIDRRAFVTSGLLSLGFAVARILQQGGGAFSSSSFVTLLTVGLVVLAIGVGWSYLRRAAFTLLPDAIKRRLPTPR